MYLSQPRDLISSMSAGCSRSTTLQPHPDNLAMLPSLKADNTVLHGPTCEPSVTHLSPSPAPDRDEPRIYDPCPATSIHGYARPERASRSSEYSKPSSLSAAMSSPESRSKSRWFRSQHFQKLWDELDAGNAETRPPHPYTELIKVCILKRTEGKLTLNQLYRDLEEKFPFFAASARGKGWKNTLRHNLSTQPYFIKLDREHGQLGKGHYWAYCPDLEKPTSLAQSSVVQLSSLWPPSVSAASVPLRQDSARNYCSATEFQHAPPDSCKVLAPVTDLPRFDDYNTRQELHELPRFSRKLTQDVPHVGAQRQVPATVLTHRLSSPQRDVRSLPLHDASPSNPIRMRSATISTISRPSMGSPVCSSAPEQDRRRSSSFWPASSSSPASSLSDANRESDDFLSRPALPDLPRMLFPARKSLGDYYLSHPISTPRRKSSIGSPTSALRPRGSPY